MLPSTPSMDPGTWHVQHSSRRLWHLKRNVHVIADAGVLEYTYQSETASEIQTHKEADWKIVETGRDGKLETWMIETEAGIQDAAGEIRADWRTRWLAVVVSRKPDHFEGIDILCNRRERISEGTMKDVEAILKSKSDLFPEFKQVQFVMVPDDGARNEEMKRAEEERLKAWEKRTGKDEGISEDLVYDDVDEERESKCGIQ